MSKQSLNLDESLTRTIVDQLNGLDYGNVNIVVHGGQIVQIERTQKTRMESVISRGQTVKEKDSN